MIKRFVWLMVYQNPMLRFREVVLACNSELNLDVKPWWLHQVFKKWRWTFHKAWQENQIHKYTEANMACYRSRDFCLPHSLPQKGFFVPTLSLIALTRQSKLQQHRLL
eukprot:TRINITY_DN2470_c0_g1_i3.p1 TRINITY_DN2470_c0_g1~~TRINITY_DN2470_c0_g1_i3.p1  ORF type:complete len:108 (+),score=13.56 TRINITY_DN2470_c0_g1_i3:203-526(+)